MVHVQTSIAAEIRLAASGVQITLLGDYHSSDIKFGRWEGRKAAGSRLLRPTDVKLVHAADSTCKLARMAGSK